MRILYLIGNGFDLAYGLKTKYTDFYEKFVEPSAEDSEDVKKLKNNIGDNYSTWADLEKAIGEYASGYNSSVLFEETFYYLKDSLQKYISEIDKSFNPTDSQISYARNSIMHPELQLEEADLSPYQSFISSVLPYSPGINIDVVTLNYSRTFEKIFGNNYTKSLSNDYRIMSLRHLHGVIDDTIIMGVNDPSQIDNPSFRENEDLMGIVVKPEVNDAMRNLSNSRVEELIKNANVIVLFGVSLGKTDSKWWDLIGQQYARDSFRLMYFYYTDDGIPINRKEMTGRLYRKCVHSIIDKFSIPEELVKSIDPKTSIAINKPLFK